MTEEALLHEALAKPAGERAAFLDVACAGRPELRAAVEARLAAQDGPGNLLDRTPALGQTVDPEQGQHLPVATTNYRPQAGPGLLIAGRYTLAEKIGEGGMGEVWVARQTEPVKRKVALKLIKAGMDSKAVLARFEAERQALALMDHPNIARVLDGGLTPDGRPFFVMELVNGLPLTKFCDEAKLTPRQRLELFVPVCQAVQHAHTKGIIHRDLKAANILVSLVDGKPLPKVIDFGVAKATAGKLTDESLSTQFGAVIGTLEYMAPEQAGFAGEDIDTRADVYSLGVILYELLTGLRPLDARRIKKAGLTEMVRILREEEPAKPSTRLATEESLPSLAALRQTEPKKLLTLLRGELDWVVLKCLEKRRDRRYETANALARDVQRYLADEPVEARPPSARYRLGKFLRRNKGSVIAASLALLAMFGALIGSVYGLMEARKQREATALREQAEQERDAATRARAEAEDAREKLALASYARSVDLAHRAWAENQVGRARELLASCPPALRGWEWHYVHRLCHAELLTVTGHGRLFTSASFSPDGSRLVTGCQDDKMFTVRVWDAATGKELLVLRGHDAPVLAPAFAPDGTRIVGSDTKGVMRVWDARTGATLRQTEGSGASDWVSPFSPDGLRLVTVNKEGAVRVCDTVSGKTLLSLQASKEPLVPEAFSPDGSRFVAGRLGAPTRWMCDAKTGTVLCPLAGDNSSAKSFSPDGAAILMVDRDDTARILDAKTGKERCVLRGHAKQTVAAAFSPDGARVLTASFDGTARLWDAKTGAELRVLRGHTGRLTAAAFAPDGSRMATSGEDGVRLWDARAADPGVTVLDMARREHFATFHGADRRALSDSVAPDGSRYVNWGNGDTAAIVDAQTDAELVVLKGHTGLIANGSFSPDGTRVATASRDGTARVWDARTGAVLAVMRPPNGVSATDRNALPSFSPDASRLVTVGGEETVRVWDTSTGAEVLALNGHTGWVCYASFSADGTRIVTAGLDATIRLWDAATGKELLVLKGHIGPVTAVSLSRDGSRIVSGGYDTTVRVWDVKTGAELLTLKGHQHPLHWVAFTPDGARVVSRDRGNGLRVWGGTPLIVPTSAPAPAR
jgi:WD40 repeat protein/serine/threonine protein kinase